MVVFCNVHSALKSAASVMQILTKGKMTQLHIAELHCPSRPCNVSRVTRRPLEISDVILCKIFLVHIVLLRIVIALYHCDNKCSITINMSPPFEYAQQNIVGKVLGHPLQCKPLLLQLHQCISTQTVLATSQTDSTSAMILIPWPSVYEIF